MDYRIGELADILMTLLILTTKCRSDLDSMLIEDITLLSYDLDYGWISLILMMFSPISDLGIRYFS